MFRNHMKRRGATTFAAAAAAVLLGAASAGADVTVERTMKSAGFGGFGASDSTMVEKTSGLRQRQVSAMKMTGFIGKMAGDLGSDEITDIQKDVVWKLDHKKKTYTESKITQPLPQKEQGTGGRAERAEKKEKPTVRVVRNEITVKETGEKKTIGEYACEHYVITWVVETENIETKERGESTMITDLWTTPETAEIKQLQKEEREYTQAWLKKIGWDLTDKEAQQMGLSMVGALIGGDEASFKKGAKEVAEKMAKIHGYPIATGIKWLVRNSGGSAAKEGGGESAEGVPDISKGFGGLMSALGKKVAKSGGESAGSSDAGGPKPVFDTYMEIRKISTASLPDADFAPPAGYKKVE
jgi:hypothetical protein